MPLHATTSNQPVDSNFGPSAELQERVFGVLQRDHRQDLLSRGVDGFLLVLIVLSTVAIVLESVGALFTACGALLFWVAAFAVSVFVLECLLRVLKLTRYSAAFEVLRRP